MAYTNGNPSGAVGDSGPTNGSTATTARPAIIAEQMNGLEQRVEGLHTMLSELEGRMVAVLMPAPPVGLDKEGQPTIPVPLGSSLAQANGRLSQGLNRLQELIERIEL